MCLRAKRGRARGIVCIYVQRTAESPSVWSAALNVSNKEKKEKKKGKRERIRLWRKRIGPLGQCTSNTQCTDARESSSSSSSCVYVCAQQMKQVLILSCSYRCIFEHLCIFIVPWWIVKHFGCFFHLIFLKGEKINGKRSIQLSGALCCTL